jgi:hypothetical protein
MEVENMIIRLVLYHARSDSDPLAWVEEHGDEIRGFPGIRRVDFVQSKEDPSRWGATMHFSSKAELEVYKESMLFKRILESLTEEVVDSAKPVYEHLFELVDV